MHGLQSLSPGFIRSESPQAEHLFIGMAVSREGGNDMPFEEHVRQQYKTSSFSAEYQVFKLMFELRYDAQK